MISHNASFDGKILDILVIGLVAFARIESVEPFTSRNIHPQSHSLKFYNRNHSFKKIQNDKVFNSKPEKRITKIVIRASNDDNDISSSPKEDEEAKQWLSGKQWTDRNSAARSGESDITWKIESDANIENESSYTPVDFSDIEAILDPDHDSFLMNAWNEFQMNSGVPNQGGMASAGAIAEFLLRNELEQRYIQGEISQAELEDDMQTIKDYMSRKQESEKPPPISQLKDIAKEERSKRLDIESRLAKEISSKQTFKEDILAEMKRVEENASKIEKEREAEKAEIEKVKQEAKKAEEDRLAETEKWKEELKVEEDRRKESEQREEELRRKEEEMNALIAQKQKLKEKYIAEKLEEKRQEKIRLEQWAKESSGRIQSPEEDTAYKLYLEWMADELNEKPTNEMETETDQGRIKQIISNVKSSFGITKTDSEQIGSKIAETKVIPVGDVDKVAGGSNEKSSAEESKDYLSTYPSVDQPAQDELAANVAANKNSDKSRTEKLKELYIAQKLREKRFKERETTISQEESIVMRSVEKARLEEELRLKNETEILSAVKKEKNDVTEQERIDNDRREYAERIRREEEMILLDEEESRRQAHLKPKSKQPDMNEESRLESTPKYYQTDKMPLDESEEKNRREQLKKKFLTSRQNPDLEQTNDEKKEQQKFDLKMVLDSKQLVHNEKSNSNEVVRLAEQDSIEDDTRRKQELDQHQKQLEQQQEEERLREEAHRKADEKKLKEARLAEQARIEDDTRRKQEQQQEEERLREEAHRKADEKKLKEARIVEQARIEDNKRQKQELEQQQKQLKQQQEEERLREEAKKLKEAHLLEIRLAKQKREREEQIRKTNELMMSVQENVKTKKILDQSHVSVSRTAPKTFKVMRRTIEIPSDGSIRENANDGNGNENSLIMHSSTASRSRLFRIQARTSDILKRITASAKKRMTEEFEEEETDDHSETSEMDDKKFTYRKSSRNSRLFIKPTPYRYGEFRKVTTSKSSRGKKRDGSASEKTKTIVLSTLVLMLMRRVLQLSFVRFPI